MEGKRVNINIPFELHEMLKTEATKVGIPVSGLINIAIKEYLKQNSVLDMVSM